MDSGTAQLNRLDALAAELATNASPERAAPMAQYMRNQFAFFGIPSPQRRAIQREVLGHWIPDQAELVTFVDAAWSRPERELQYASCDLVAAHPELASVMDDWIAADDFWLARVAIIYQLRFKGATDEDRLFRYCAVRADDTEFFIRKAIGWALREYSKTNPTAVVEFVRDHELAPLSRREALRRIVTT